MKALTFRPQISMLGGKLAFR